MPLFVSDSGELNPDQEKAIASHACVMPPSEHIFKDLRSKEDISRFEMLESRKILCPLCPVSSEKITNAVHYQMLHNSEKVVPVVIYSEVELSPKVRVRIPTTTPIAKDLEVVCPQCGLSEFDSVATLESHFALHAECRRKSCPECSMQFTQEALFRDHLLSHLGTRACYLAIYLAYACTFISRGVSSCGAISLSSDGGVAFGGVSSVIFTSRLTTSNVDPWECVTLKKKANRRGRKRRAGPAYKKEQDEIETESIANDENSAKIRNILVRIPVH
ncbi:unnamed protein product [Heligmosomoides polygyrus]|uniref:C2H2-type domain-containing protein n=1 Tax=Heligmosomoides polygyrus TaxID=6339 RepID=A0A183GNC7_HELPZ|nr:unnamed protein product [Heligmosomoides polygyrus]